MKKVTNLILSLVLCCIIVTGCSEKEDISPEESIPHNAKLCISDIQSDIEKVDSLESDNDYDYKLDEPVKLGGKEFTVTYQFNNDGEIADLFYDSEEATIEEAQSYIDDIYGELDKDSQNDRYIIKSHEKTWLIGCFTNEEGNTRIVITRAANLD